MRLTLPLAACLALALMADAASARADSLSGAWSGSGTVRLKSGQVEKVRCRVSYSKSTGKTYLLTARCAHSAGTFAQTGRVVQISGTRFRGRLYSEQYQATGNVVIAISGGRQTISVSSPKGSARFALAKR